MVVSDYKREERCIGRAYTLSTLEVEVHPVIGGVSSSGVLPSMYVP